MQVHILLFATLKDLAGQNRFTLSLVTTPATVRGVRQALARAWAAGLGCARAGLVQGFISLQRALGAGWSESEQIVTAARTKESAQ